MLNHSGIRRLVLHNDVQQISLLSCWMEEVAQAYGLDLALTLSLNLAVEEAVTNVILYAYPPETRGELSLDCVRDDEGLQFILSDAGKPFDPTAAPPADITLSAEERAIGGLGIHLVRTIMDQVHYRYQDGNNILTMIKKL